VTGEPAAARRDEPYGGGMTVGAVILTLASPVIALAVALIMLAGEDRASRRRFLRRWAWISGGLVVAGVAIAAILVAVSSSSG
jgi:hypothetical protein